MESEPGTYALILRSRSSVEIRVGRWGRIDLEPGYYVYVGSAFGPGGVRARVSRHCRRAKRRHWHIDYLREFARPLGAWYSHDARRLEHRWARLLSDMDGMSPIPGFGCSDCRCRSHLFRTSAAPDLALFSRIAGVTIHPWSYRPGSHGHIRRSA